MSTQSNTPANEAAPLNNTVGGLRDILFAQLRSLREATPDKLANELKRAKGVSEISKQIVDTARVEVEFARVTRTKSVGFLQSGELPAPEAASGAPGGQADDPPEPSAPAKLPPEPTSQRQVRSGRIIDLDTGGQPGVVGRRQHRMA